MNFFAEKLFLAIIGLIFFAIMFWLDIPKWGIPIIFGFLLFIVNIIFFPNDPITPRRCCVLFIISIVIGLFSIVLAKQYDISIFELAVIGNTQSRLGKLRDIAFALFTYSLLLAMFLLTKKLSSTDV